jgi:dolichol-phosphate mannosyltransferase
MDDENKTLISIVVPLLNELKNILLLYERVRREFGSLKNKDFELIFVDDGSTDGSWQEIRKLAAQDRRIRGISLSRNFGHQIALSAGIDQARGEAVIMMDADLQHPPEVIPAMLDHWEKGYEIVYTVREMGHETWFKKKASRMFYRIFTFFTGIDIPAGAADFRLMSRKVVLSLQRFPERTRFLRGLIFWMGFPRIGVPYKCGARASGASKYTLKRMWFFAIDGVSSFSTVPLYFSIVFGAIISLVSFVYGCFAIYTKLFTNVNVPGWTSILVSVLFLGGVQLIAIGVLGNYLAKTYEEVKQRPLYLINDQVSN